MNVHRRHLVLFVLTATLSGWVGVAVDRLRGQQPAMNTEGALIWVLAPVLAAAGLGLRGSGGWSKVLRPRLRSKAGWYAAGAALFPAVTAATIGLGAAAGRVDLTGFDLRTLLGQGAQAAVPAMVKNLAEEASWRVFLTDELLRHGLPDPVVDVVLGLVWGLWHAPYYLEFLPEEAIREILDVPRPVFAAIAVGVMTSWGIVYTELYRVAGSAWPHLLMHTVEDIVVNPLVLEGHARIAPEAKAVFSPVVGVVSTVLIGGAGLALRAWRRRRGGGPARSMLR